MDRSKIDPIQLQCLWILWFILDRSQERSQTGLEAIVTEGFYFWCNIFRHKGFRRGPKKSRLRNRTDCKYFEHKIFSKNNLWILTFHCRFKWFLYPHRFRFFGYFSKIFMLSSHLNRVFSRTNHFYELEITLHETICFGLLNGITFGWISPL